MAEVQIVHAQAPVSSTFLQWKTSSIILFMCADVSVGCVCIKDTKIAKTIFSPIAGQIESFFNSLSTSLKHKDALKASSSVTFHFV